MYTHSHESGRSLLSGAQPVGTRDPYIQHHWVGIDKRTQTTRLCSYEGHGGPGQRKVRHPAPFPFSDDGMEKYNMGKPNEVISATLEIGCTVMQLDLESSVEPIVRLD